MSSFSKHHFSFAVQIAGDTERDVHPGMPFMDFWGDQYEWVARLPLAWKAYQLESSRILPGLPEVENALSWWTVPLHLLGMGLGWTNLALGLNYWRQGGYKSHHPILNFLYESYGSSLEALEVFLVDRPWINQAYLTALKSHAKPDFEPDDEFPPDFYVKWGIETEDRYIDNAKGRHDFGPRWQMAIPLHSGGDGLHLSRHFPESVIFNSHRNHVRADLDELELLWISKEGIGIESPDYKGFPARLSEAHQIHQRKFPNEEGVVSLHVRTLGHLGDFWHSDQTGRFFISSSQFRFEEDHAAHLLGNCS